MFWGITPALDLQQQYLFHFEETQVLNILLVGSQDARHVLMTLSQRFRHKPVKIIFFIIEFAVELIGRQLLLLNFAFEEQSQMNLFFKTRTFMDIYGNTLMRPTVARYLAAKSGQLIQMITDLDYCNDIMSFVTLNNLKYIERDYLENLFKYWSSFDPFNISELWDKRVRQLLGVRYDSRMGLFDWDVHMKLHSAGATQINSREYKHWRSTGVAFTWLESEVSKANRTLVGGLIPSGEMYYHHGYLGDIATGPYISFGLHCENKDMLKKQNGTPCKRATDITEHNIMKLFHELQNQNEYVHEKRNDLNLGNVVCEMSENRVVDNHRNNDELTTKIPATDTKCAKLVDVTINFISHSMLKHMPSKTNYKRLFDVIYYSGMGREKINPDFVNAVSNDNCLLMVENHRYVPDNRKEQLEEMAKKLNETTEHIDDLRTISFEPEKDDYAKFVVERKENKCI